MKKTTLILFIIISILQFTGCNNEIAVEQTLSKTGAPAEVTLTPSPPATTFLPAPLPQPVGSDKPDAPAFNKEAGVYERSEPLVIEIERPEGDGKIFYTLNGVRPDRSSAEYKEPITVLNSDSTAVVLSAVFITDKGAVSDVVYAKYEYHIKFEDEAVEQILLDYFEPEDGGITYSMIREVKEFMVVGEYAVINESDRFIEELDYEFKKNIYSYDTQIIGERGSIKSLNDLSWMYNLNTLVIDYNQITEVSSLPDMIDIISLKNNSIVDISGICEGVAPSVVVLDNNQITNTAAIGGTNNYAL